MAKIDDGFEIDYSFPDERVLVAFHNLIPQFADYANYLGSDIMPPDLNTYQRLKFIPDVRKFFLDNL